MRRKRIQNIRRQSTQNIRRQRTQVLKLNVVRVMFTYRIFTPGKMFWCSQDPYERLGWKALQLHFWFFYVLYSKRNIQNYPNLGQRAAVIPCFLKVLPEVFVCEFIDFWFYFIFRNRREVHGCSVMKSTAKNGAGSTTCLMWLL